LPPIYEKRRWPTLKDRLNQLLTTREEAVKQMKANGDELTKLALKYLKKNTPLT
jgi:hypothetical protein